MKENPAPGSYDSACDIRNKGPTFGISRKFYEKVMIPKEKIAGLISNRSKNVFT